MFLAAAKHAEFVRARDRHYSNEAEAMKVSIVGTVNQVYMSLNAVLLACGADDG